MSTRETFFLKIVSPSALHREQDFQFSSSSLAAAANVKRNYDTIPYNTCVSLDIKKMTNLQKR
jgi:hypothetical protein